MARARDPNRDKAFEIYKEHNGDITNRAIAEKLGVPEKTIGSWKSKSKDNWNEKLNGVLQTDERSTPIKSVKRERGAPIGNANAKGNRGNKNASAPKQNSNALTHGFFQKFLPEETLEIMEAMNERSPADLIWDQIQIQYAAIIRAQRIMHVESKDEIIKELKKAKYDYYPRSKEDGGGVEKAVTEEEYEFQFAWERQAQLLTAQSRAIGELRSSIRQFVEMADQDDERRLKLEQMQLGIDKTKLEIEKIQSGDTTTQESEIAKMLRKMAGEE
ncbi:MULTISPECIES: phage terminase small subunit [Lysinibacillus]|uniref:Phage terminase small subunit n=1 Tax=Lysinibacillus capsici TaxID=2115968 RepID=A0ABY8KNX7_9BACI|nr:phage terminase small subunit [Lysinibacillus capsici]WGF40263.1 phage terminase small subunit [Lysinibacillus capsici]